MRMSNEGSVRRRKGRRKRAACISTRHEQRRCDATARKPKQGRGAQARGRGVQAAANGPQQASWGTWHTGWMCHATARRPRRAACSSMRPKAQKVRCDGSKAEATRAAFISMRPEQRRWTAMRGRKGRASSMHQHAARATMVRRDSTKAEANGTHASACDTINEGATRRLESQASGTHQHAAHEQRRCDATAQGPKRAACISMRHDQRK